MGRRAVAAPLGSSKTGPRLGPGSPTANTRQGNNNMTEEKSQVADRLIGLISTIRFSELEDIEQALHFGVKTLGDFLDSQPARDTTEFDSIYALRTLLEIHRARFQRERCERERAGWLKKNWLIMRTIYRCVVRLIGTDRIRGNRQ